MKDLLGSGMLDPRDMERYEGLALLLGALRTAADRTRFGGLYRQVARDDGAEEAITGLLRVAAGLWAREGDREPTPAPGRVPAQAA